MARVLGVEEESVIWSAPPCLTLAPSQTKWRRFGFQLDSTIAREPKRRHKASNPESQIRRRTPNSAPENLGQLLRRNDVELIVSAVGRLLVFAPSSKLRRVTKAAALHVIVSNFDHQLRAQRLPREIFSCAPATLSAGNPMS